jgi:DNA-binding NtrC family response regulator
VYLAQIAADQQNRELQASDAFDAEGLQPDTIQPERWMLGPMAGRSLVMQQLFARMRCTAPYFRLVNVEAEQGSGKLLAAQTLHGLGPSASGPFVPVVASEFLDDPQTLWKEARAGLVYLSRVDELSPERQRGLRDFIERAAHERIRTTKANAPMQIVAGSLQSLRRLRHQPLHSLSPAGYQPLRELRTGRRSIALPLPVPTSLVLEWGSRANRAAFASCARRLTSTRTR